MSQRYPTPEHERAAAAIVRFFAGRDGVEAVLLTNSCARGRATRDSCLDMVVLVPEGWPGRPALERAWAAYVAADDVFAELRRAGAFSVVHLDLVDGHFAPPERDEDSGPDWFEVELGNYLVYAAPLWQGGDRYARLRAAWLPYYDEALRQERLIAVRRSCEHHLDHIPHYVARGLHFQSFDRLYTSFQLFLQGLFIARRVYPIAYNKWIREQIAEILGLPALYDRLPRLFQIRDLESAELIAKADDLRALLEEYVMRDA
jgi:predicted nucleotidyltransferase